MSSAALTETRIRSSGLSQACGSHLPLKPEWLFYNERSLSDITAYVRQSPEVYQNQLVASTTRVALAACREKLEKAVSFVLASLKKESRRDTAPVICLQALSLRSSGH